MWPKIVQVNATDVYIAGGNNNDCEDNIRNGDNEYSCVKTTLKVNIVTGLVTKCANMLKARQAHGICSIGNSIIVVGGHSKGDGGSISQCD